MNKAYYRQRNVKFPVKNFFGGLIVVLLVLAVIGLLPLYQYGTVESVYRNIIEATPVTE